MREINLLKSVKKTKRNINLRKIKKNQTVIKIAKKFGKEYFDGPRTYGYGGYRYDGRWKSTVKDFIKFYKLRKGDKVLDIGCAKGFFVNDLVDKGIDAYGIDISSYAIKNCHPKIKNRLKVGNATKIPFADKSFKLVTSINTLHNLTKIELKKAISEILRVKKLYSFIQVDSYKNINDKRLFLNWVLTAKTHMYPDDWKKFFLKNKYDGDFYWTFL
tara:strand:- start:1633 stop:2280 length:648 start_codon:yes stop_codon:yes gene_type:complete